MDWTTAGSQTSKISHFRGKIFTKQIELIQFGLIYLWLHIITCMILILPKSFTQFHKIMKNVKNHMYKNNINGDLKRQIICICILNQLGRKAKSVEKQMLIENIRKDNLATNISNQVSGSIVFICFHSISLNIYKVNQYYWL